MSTEVAPGKLNKTESVFRFKTKKKLAESGLCNQDPKARSEKNKPVTQSNISRAQSRGPDVSGRHFKKREGGTMEPHYLIKMTIKTMDEQPIKYSNGLRRKV